MHGLGVGNYAALDICYLAVYAGHDKRHITSTHPDHKWYTADYERTLGYFKRDYLDEL